MNKNSVAMVLVLNLMVMMTTMMMMTTIIMMMRMMMAMMVVKYDGIVLGNRNPIPTALGLNLLQLLI